MGRLFLIAVFLVVIVAMIAILVSIIRAAFSAGQDAARPYFGPDQGGLMAPTALQKVAYIALIIVLLGVTSGLIGGL